MDKMRIFYDIACAGIERGRDVSLELKDYEHHTKGIAGIGAGDTVDNGMMLRVYSLEVPEEQPEGEEEGSGMEGDSEQ